MVRSFITTLTLLALGVTAWGQQESLKLALVALFVSLCALGAACFAAYITFGSRSIGAGGTITTNHIQDRLGRQHAIQSESEGDRECPCGLPPQLKQAIEVWLKANNKTPYEVRYAAFPIGMVQRWIERTTEAESKLEKLKND